MVCINGGYHRTQRTQMMERTVKLIGLNHHVVAAVAYHKVAAYVLEYAAQKCVAAIWRAVHDMGYHG